MDKNMEVRFSYGDKDFKKIISSIVIRKLDLYKEELMNREKDNDVSEDKIENEQLLGRHKE